MSKPPPGIIMTDLSGIARLRAEYHAFIRDKIIRITPGGVFGDGYPNFADGNSKTSVAIANGIHQKLLQSTVQSTGMFIDSVAGQTKGDKFEDATLLFVQKSFDLLAHLRPGKWRFAADQSIASFDQYRHLAYLNQALERDKALKAMLGASGDYIVKPDIIVARLPVSDDQINMHDLVIDEKDKYASNTRLRERNNPAHLLLHASISCKWTIRSDRTQNTRTEALNLIRNRKGNLPHIVAVTAEPMPTRIASIALGTGDLDCVYHFALHELRDSLVELENEDQLDMLDVMIDGMRLRDISDLPFDLAT